MKFRPCIDLHDGKVKQIVGSSLKDSGEVQTNFISERPPAFFADLYYQHHLTGGHVIMLGKGNEQAAQEALAAHPGLLQVGGGITPDNAKFWLDAGASHVIVTSTLFADGEFQISRLEKLSQLIGNQRLVVDLSCIPFQGAYHVACNRWQTICQMQVNGETLKQLSRFCGEYLIHAVSVEGKQGGIDAELVSRLAEWSPLPVTYAGGIRNLQDIETIHTLGRNIIDFTVGSALDIFGGPLSFQEIVHSQR